MSTTTNPFRSDQDKTERVLSTVGPRLSAVAMGFRDARLLIPMRQGQTNSELISMRLNVLVSIVDSLLARGMSAAEAASFLRSSNDELGGDSVVLTIADLSLGEDQKLLNLLNVSYEYLDYPAMG